MRMKQNMGISVTSLIWPISAGRACRKLFHKLSGVHQRGPSDHQHQNHHHHHHQEVLCISRIRKSLRWENWRVYLDSSKDPWCCSRMRLRMAREHVRLPTLTASLVTVVGTDITQQKPSQHGAQLRNQACPPANLGRGPV